MPVRTGFGGEGVNCVQYNIYICTYIYCFFTYFLVLFRKLFQKSKISLYFMI